MLLEFWSMKVVARATLFALLLAMVAAAAPRQTALVIGVSQYSRLPKELWLQYPASDAEAVARFLESPRGGGIPTDSVTLLTNKAATRAAVREALDQLRSRSTPDDAVYIFVAAHGVAGPQGAYILTTDADPNDLANTAIAMADLQKLVQTELADAGRVVLLADVCHAATIGNLKTGSLGEALAAIGKSAGDMLGLMAARPAEVSFEGPQFGNGHGAFTWAVLEALNGKADADGDGKVDAGELIDYVRGAVSRMTNGRQHPRDFGNMDNDTVLADLNAAGPER